MPSVTESGTKSSARSSNNERTPVPQTTAILGHVTVETAKRKRNCSRHRKGAAAHDIVMSELCLVVKDGDGVKRNYCIESAQDILERAETDLDSLRSRLGL